MTENTQEKVTAEVPDLTRRDKIDTYIRSTFLLGFLQLRAYASHWFCGVDDTRD